MKTKRIAALLFAFCVLLLSAACKADFVGNKIKTSDKYLLSFYALNTTEKETLGLKEGEKLSVRIELTEGEVSLLVQNRGNEGDALYRGNGLQNESFTLICKESGTYSIEATGKAAKGKLLFEKIK